MKKVKTPPPTLDKPLDIGEIKTENATQAREIHQSIKKRVGNMKKSVEKFTVVQVDELISEIDSLVRSKRHDWDRSGGLKMTGRQVMAQLADLESCSADDAEAWKSFRDMKKELEQHVPIVLDRELFQWFLGEMSKHRSELEVLRPLVAEAQKAAQVQEQEATIRRKIAAMKGYDDMNMLSGDVIKQAEVCGSIPKATRDLLFHPVWMSRKLEKEFTCIVEKSHDVHSKNDGCYIAGTTRDVDACIKKLETVDFESGKLQMLLDGKTIGSVMGVGGANAYEIEKECNVILYAPPGSVELTIFGNEKAVKKALEKIGAVKQISSPSDVSAITSERVESNTAVAKAIQGLSIEEDCGVSITVSPSVDSVRESVITVRGTPEGVARAIHEIHASIKRINLESLAEMNKDAVDVLFSSASFGRKGFGEIKLAVRFADLKKRASIVRVDDSEIHIASVNDMEEIVNELYDLLTKALFTTEKVELNRDHSRCWNEQISSQVGLMAGDELTVFLRRSDESNQFWLELWGTERARSNALRLVDEVHDARIVTVPEQCVKPMLENKCQVLQSIQTDAIVTAYFSRMTMELYFYGLDQNKKEAVKLFNEFVESVHQEALQHTVKTIPIASDEIGRLIGPKGRTMNAIKEKTQLEEVRISEQEKRVYLTGSNSSIDYAISLIEEELSGRKDASVVQIGLAEDETTTALLNGVISGIKPVGGLLGSKTNEWVSNQEEKQQTEIVAVDSQEVFPSLGAPQTKTVAKPKWKR
jgi:rRNA processing protein Krr1/Pno1